PGGGGAQPARAPPPGGGRGTRNSGAAGARRAGRGAPAPAVPQRRPCHCRFVGSVRTASAMTSALSPAKVRSMTTMLSQRAQNSGSSTGSMASAAHEPEQRDHDLAEHQEGHGNGEALVLVDTHPASPCRRATATRGDSAEICRRSYRDRRGWLVVFAGS